MTHRATRHSSRSSRAIASRGRVRFTGSAAPAPRHGGYARLALAVLKQAVDDAQHGVPVNVEDLRVWARVAGMPMYDVEQAIEG